jgi:hypothetical protein
MQLYFPAVFAEAVFIAVEDTVGFYFPDIFEVEVDVVISLSGVHKMDGSPFVYGAIIIGICFLAS